MITPHLKEAINALGLLTNRKTEWIWIDQICINQDDKKERAIQVDMMKHIYSLSLGTIIWLGTNVPNVETILSLVDRMSILYEQDLNPNGTRRRSRYTWDEYLSIGLPSAKDPAWIAFGQILSRPWFIRSWVIQEAALSKVPPQMICGTQELSWEKFVPAASWLLSMCYQFTPLNISLKSPTIPALRSLKLFNELVQSTLPWDLTTLLNKSIRFKASEPRDKVYSLLALTKEADTGKLPLSLQANYERPVEQVFRDVTRHIVTSTRSLAVLSLIRYVPDWDRYSSWVVDFTAQAQWDRLSYFNWDQNDHTARCLVETLNHSSAGRPAVVAKDLPDHILGLEGLEIDTVNAVHGAMSKPELVSFKSRDIWFAWKEACQRLEERYPTTEAIARAFMVTLTANWSLNDHERMSDQPLSHFWQYLSQVYHQFRDSGSKDELDADRETTKYQFSPHLNSDRDANLFSLHLDAAYERRLFFTKDLSYIGLGPRIMEKNDILCVLFGGATPFVLRRVGKYYRLVGECYVFDLMSGEAIGGWKKGKFSVKMTIQCAGLFLTPDLPQTLDQSITIPTRRALVRLAGADMAFPEYEAVHGILLDYIPEWKVETLCGRGAIPTTQEAWTSIMQKAVDATFEFNQRGIILQDCSPFNVIVHAWMFEPFFIDFATVLFKDKMVRELVESGDAAKEDWDGQYE
ncbi:heterokaryon incompatibility protein [Fusarium austroafricanum]|uniref:Heterokaryon incompatibility protein n=1 Tax=Fusarium austroafricanum TaxID=2364996 RepID=A0A8H4KGP7_9HYPO|nr:heterokaryon incompatibility protein [Fusarium austroafricanum]